MKQSSKIIIDQDKLAKKRTYHIIKRIFDFIASLCGLIILSPLFLIVALLIKLEDNGPVFYKQKRVGKGQREFDMFKFRSMHVDADKRLAQLFNVVRGDMSLVGPRPPLPSEVAEYTDYDMQRLLVVPGCSGLWQATVRNSVGFHEMVQLDLEYIQKSSIWFDIKILFMTIKILFKPNSAY